MCLRQGPCEHRRDESNDPGGNHSVVPSDGSCVASKGTWEKKIYLLYRKSLLATDAQVRHMGNQIGMVARAGGEKPPETHLLRFLSHLRRRDDSGVGGVLGAPHKLRLGQLLSAVLLHSLSLQLGNASVLGSEDLG